MLRHLLHRRGRRPRTSIIPPRHPRDNPRPWRRALAWAALLTLVASAIYFSLTERADRGAPPADLPPANVPDVH